MATYNEKKFETVQGIQYVVRSAKYEDGESILNYNIQIMNDSAEVLLTMPEELDMTVEQESRWLKKMEESVSDLALVATHNSEVIGFLDFSAGHRKRIAHTGDFGMSVKKEFRGQGVGSALLGSLIEWATNSQYIEKINLQVHATNMPAISLYKRKGFVIEGTRQRELKYGENKYIDSVLMAKWVKRFAKQD